MRALVLCLALLLGLAQPASAREVIRNFISTVVVNTDGSLDVVEDIVVIAEGRIIRRGIFRDFPTDYKYPDGTNMRVGFNVISVTRDGATENYATERLDNGVRIRIGSRDVMLRNGEHTYQIKYHTTRQLGFFTDYDELYWNATGNGWQFPILDARINIRLPDGASIKQAKLYTGYQGQTGSDAIIKTQMANRFEAATTRDLAESEGFTVAVAWQKGIIAAPTSNQRLLLWLTDNLGQGILAATLLGAFGLFFTAWSRVGRDPRKGTIIPLFHPPEGLGPAGVRYIWKQKYDNLAFAAAVVGLAVKGRVKIENDDGDYTITRLADKGRALSNSESALLQHLPAGRLSLDNTNHSIVNNAERAVSTVLDAEYSGSMFVKNFGWFAVGAAVSVAGLLLAGFFMPAGEGAVLTFAGVFAAVWWGVLLSVGYGAVKGLWSSGGLMTVIGGLFRLLFLVPFAVAGVAVPAMTVFQSGTSPAMLAFLAMAAVLGLMNLLFLKLLPAPTPAGRQIMDQIEGFRMYLETAEEKRLDALNPPEKTPELFERFLPYAMALECENQWNRKFAAVLAAAAAAGATAPVWYGGSHSSWSTGGFAESLSAGLSSSVSSAATPPGSSSGSGGGWSGGSGGGGSSGGGGGGGGGGGW